MESMDPDAGREAAAATDGATQLRSMVEELQSRLESINQRVKDVIKERPVACLLGAAALGYIVARIARRRS